MSHAETGGRGRTSNAPHVKAVFWSYVVLIVTGLVYFSVVGLTHH